MNPNSKPVQQCENASPASAGLSQTRRTVMRTLTLLPTMIACSTAMPLADAAPIMGPATDDRTLFRLVNELKGADERHDRAEEAHVAPAKAMAEWDRRNPKPEMRECWVGTNAEYEIWFDKDEKAETETERASAAAIDTNRDLKAAMREHADAIKVWRARRFTALMQSCFDSTLAAVTDAKATINRLGKALADQRAYTIPGIKAKSLWTHTHDRMVWSVIEDIDELDDGTPPAPLPTAARSGHSVDPIQRAYAAAAAGFSAHDWIFKCRAVGMTVYEQEGGLFTLFNDADDNERCFLNCWINLSPGGTAAVIDVLRNELPPAAAVTKAA